MSVKKLIGGLVGGVLGLVGVSTKKKKEETPQPQALPIPTRNQAAENAAKSDLTAKRRGLISNAVLGMRGAEAEIGAKSKLGS